MKSRKKNRNEIVPQKRSVVEDRSNNLPISEAYRPMSPNNKSGKIRREDSMGGLFQKLDSMPLASAPLVAGSKGTLSSSLISSISSSNSMMTALSSQASKQTGVSAPLPSFSPKSLISLTGRGTSESTKPRHKIPELKGLSAAPSSAPRKKQNPKKEAKVHKEIKTYQLPQKVAYLNISGIYDKKNLANPIMDTTEELDDDDDMIGEIDKKMRQQLLDRESGDSVTSVSQHLLSINTNNSDGNIATHNLVNDTNELVSDHGISSLHKYIQITFNKAKNQQELHYLKEQLENIIHKTELQGDLCTRDWPNYPLPSLSSKNKFGTKLAIIAPESLTNISQEKKIPQSIAFLKSKAQFEKLSSRYNSGTNQKCKSPNSLGCCKSEVSDRQELLGTSQDIEKPYFRLCAAPDSRSVRPEYVLNQALKMVKTKWKNGAEYGYVCDQLRSIRQDITIQRIKSDLRIKVYEIHTRIALQYHDLVQFNQCQHQIQTIYRNSPNYCYHRKTYLEFTAYQILYNVFQGDQLGIIKILKELPKEYKKQKCIQHALNVYKSLVNNNYIRFFKLLNTSPNMGAYLMEIFLDKIRVKSLISITKSYVKNIYTDYIAKILSFNNRQECIKFIDIAGGEVSPDGLKFNCKESEMGLMNSKFLTRKMLSGVQ